MDIQDLKRMKKESGMTNAKIAELSGVPLSTVNKIFSGATSCSIIVFGVLGINMICLYKNIRKKFLKITLNSLNNFHKFRKHIACTAHRHSLRLSVLPKQLIHRATPFLRFAIQTKQALFLHL